MRRPASFLTLIALATAFGLAHAHAQAQTQTQTTSELDRATQLHRSGDSSAALLAADRYLQDHPKDAQMRFLKAVMLADTHRTAEAIDILERLNEDFPDLAEPYNNLAVLRASTGDYAKAREALEQALRLKPAYATARENLGDVYAALAALAYADALRLEPGRAGLDAKLATLRRTASAAETTTTRSGAGTNPAP